MMSELGGEMRLCTFAGSLLYTLNSCSPFWLTSYRFAYISNVLMFVVWLNTAEMSADSLPTWTALLPWPTGL